MDLPFADPILKCICSRNDIFNFGEFLLIFPIHYLTKILFHVLY